MQTGYASLSNQRLVTDGKRVDSETLDSDALGLIPESTKHGTLHIVSVDRIAYAADYVVKSPAKFASGGTFSFLGKRILDVVGSVLIFLLLSPLILAIVIFLLLLGRIRDLPSPSGRTKRRDLRLHEASDHGPEC